MKLELISFKVCPFVQRAVITLRHKHAAYDVTYIDMDQPPAWLKEISPFGKVPLLRVDGETVVFESAVINEFIDEVTPGSMLPADPLHKALNRAWIEFGSAVTMDLAALWMAADEAAYDQILATLSSKLARVEAVKSPGPYFNGPDFSLVDASYAPLLMRMALLSESHAFIEPGRFPKLERWQETLLALPEVRGSVVPEFAELFRAHVQKNPGYGATLLAKPAAR